MQIFEVDWWRIALCVVLIILVVKRANIVALFAKSSYKKGNLKKAVSIFKAANTIGNLNVQNRLTYAYILLRNGDVEDALVVLRMLLLNTADKTMSRYRVKNLIALSYWKQGSLADAIEEMEEITADDFKNTLIYQNLGMLYNIEGDVEKALAFNEEAYEYSDDDDVIIDNLAESYRISGQLEKAAELYEKIINDTHEPVFPEAFYNYGQVLIGLGNVSEGIEMIEKSLEKPFSFLSVKSKEEVEAMLAKCKAQCE